MTWAPQITPATAILRIPALIGGYAAVLLQQSLPPAIARLSELDGEVLSVEVQAGERYEEDGTASFDPGQIVITADRLTERFDAGQLRGRVNELTSTAVLEGDAWAERDEKRARTFLNELAA